MHSCARVHVCMLVYKPICVFERVWNRKCHCIIQRKKREADKGKVKSHCLFKHLIFWNLMCNIILGHDAWYSLLRQIDDRDKFCEALIVCLSRNGRDTITHHFSSFKIWSKYNCFIDTCTVLRRFQKIISTHTHSLKS